VPIRDWLPRRRQADPGSGAAPVYVDDPRFEDWQVVGDFGDLATARAFGQSLAEAGIQSALTSDWPLDRAGRGDIALRVPPERWSEAEELLSGLDRD
jgi:hypothetical protein